MRTGHDRPPGKKSHQYNKFAYYQDGVINLLLNLSLPNAEYPLTMGMQL